MDERCPAGGEASSALFRDWFWAARVTPGCALIGCVVLDAHVELGVFEEMFGLCAAVAPAVGRKM